MEQFVSTFSASGQPPKETCRQCRFRKVRCDGRRGEKGCGDCDRLKFDCSFVAAGPPLQQPAPSTTPTTKLNQQGGRLINVTTNSADTTGSALSSPNGTTTESARVVERRRTSKACAHCRQQKVRCSGGAPCLACKKKGLACVYGTDRRRGSRVQVATSGNTANSRIAGTPTETSFPAAGGGHSQNTDDNHVLHEAADDTSATSPTTPGTTKSEPVTVTHHEPHPDQSRAEPLQLLLLPPDLQVLVEFYFHNVYPLPSYAFLHPPTTIRQCSEGALDICLSYAIAAVASHHRGPAPPDRGAVELSWIQAAEDLVWKHLEAPSLARLQALLLVVLYRVETGAIQRAFMLSSLAARAAAALRLNHERAAADGVSREVRRRTMWSLKLVERYFSTGLPEFELCPVDSIYLDLPCREHDFSATTATDPSPTTCDSGAYRLYIKLEMLRRDITKLARSLPALYQDAPLSGAQLPAIMTDFEQSLACVGADLPPPLTADRIAQLIGTPWLPRHVLVYLSYHQCHCDLYRLLLRGYYNPDEAAATAAVVSPPPPPPVLDAIEARDPTLLARAEQLCLRHATAIADVLAMLNHQSQRAQLLEFDTAICGYHATRLLLFLSQPGRQPATRPSEEWALSRAELCVASLRRFFPRSNLVRPVLDEMKKAIAAFTLSRGTPTTTTTIATPNRLPASPALSPARSRTDTNTNCTTTPPKDPSTNVGGPLSAAARVRQRLAIHSLLRQADFNEDEDQQQQQDDFSSRRGSLVAPPASSVSQRGVSPGTTVATTTTIGDNTDLSRAASSLSLYSPRPPLSVSDTESWSFQWPNDNEFGGGGGEKRLDVLDSAQLSGGGGTLSSFSFPWLQRLESLRGMNGI